MEDNRDVCHYCGQLWKTYDDGSSHCPNIKCESYEPVVWDLVIKSGERQRGPDGYGEITDETLRRDVVGHLGGDYLVDEIIASVRAKEARIGGAGWLVGLWPPEKKRRRRAAHKS